MKDEIILQYSEVIVDNFARLIQFYDLNKNKNHYEAFEKMSSYTFKIQLRKPITREARSCIFKIKFDTLQKVTS